MEPGALGAAPWPGWDPRFAECTVDSGALVAGRPLSRAYATRHRVPCSPTALLHALPAACATATDRVGDRRYRVILRFCVDNSSRSTAGHSDDWERRVTVEGPSSVDTRRDPEGGRWRRLDPWIVSASPRQAAS